MTEEQMIAALEGHFYKMHYTRNGIEVLDVANVDAPEYSEEEEMLPKPPAKRGYYPPNSIDWRDKDDRVLEMREAGASFKEIGRTLDVSDASVRARYVKLCRLRGLDIDTSCVPLRKVSPEVEAEIVKARDAGYAFKTIAKRFNLSESGVHVIYYRWYREKQEAA